MDRENGRSLVTRQSGASLRLSKKCIGLVSSMRAGKVPARGRIQSQIQDFPKEGARFRVKCHVDAIQWGGGVVAEFFRDLKKPMRLSGGGGG